MDGHMTREDILARLAAHIRETIDEEWVREIPITFDTSFSADLELESIEFVALAERLREEYGAQVDFARWLADKELGEIIGLSVGEVVEFIDECLSSNIAA
jgi:acyl carrier protein